MITVGLLALSVGFAALGCEEGPMSSWTAEVEWHEDLRGGGQRRLLEIQGQESGSFQVDPMTGTVTATITMQAPDLLLALDAVLRLVEGLAGQHVTLNRITATDTDWHDSAGSNGRAEEIPAMSRRAGQSRT